MKVGDLVTAKNHTLGIYGVNLETGEYIRIKPNAPPQIITKIIQTKSCDGLEVEIYLPWRNEKIRVTGSNFTVIGIREKKSERSTIKKS